MAERVSDGGLTSERVITVGRRMTERVDGLGNAALRIVHGARRVAASVGLRNLPLEFVVAVGRRHARLRGRGNKESVRGNRGCGRRRGRIARHGRFGRSVAIADREPRRGVAAEVDGDGFGIEARKAGASGGHQLRLGAIVPVVGELPRLAPPVASELHVARLVRGHEVGAIPADLISAVHVKDG